MQYLDTDDRLDTPKKILKVNHAGEFGAINMYRSQITIGRMLNRDYVPVLEGFLEDEKRHLQIFWREIQRRDGVRCKSYWLCGLGGWFLGIISALFGRRGVMACTLAVESVVAEHLKSQLVYLRAKNDKEAYAAVEAILDDELNHRDFGAREGGTNMLYTALRLAISIFTEATIRFGMR